MSKKHIEAVIRAQYKALTAKDNKERLNYMIAGIEDGQFYTYAHGKTFGVFDTEVPDAVFIPKTDLELSRITGAKLASVTLNMTKFFDTYYGDESPEKGEASDSNDTSTDKPAKAKDEDEKVVKKDKEVGKTELSEGVIEKLVKECKKCIKGGDLKKAKKILTKLEGTEFHKKLSKKLKKAQ